MMTTDLKTQTTDDNWDQIPNDDWNILVEKIYSQKCVAFLGAGVNVKCGDEDSLPVGAEVALQLLERMIRRRDEISDLSYGINWKNLKQYREDAAKLLAYLVTVIAEKPQLTDAQIQECLREKILSLLPDEKAKVAHVIFDESLTAYEDLTRVALQDLARVSLRYKRNRNLQDFVNELKEIIPDVNRKPSRLLRTLATMPFRLIVTTNYDRLMERALELFTEDDLIDPDSLSESVKRGPGEVAEVVREMMSSEMEKLVDKFSAASPPVKISRSSWVSELNSLIQQYRLFDFGNPNELYKRPGNNEEVKRNRQLLEQSFPAALRDHAKHKPYELIVQPIKGFKGTEENRIRKMLSLNNGLILYKLHGTFTDEAKPAEETRPLITEEDYIEFLTFVGGKGETIDKQITAEIQTSTLLFLGYSLEDWNFRALFKGLIENIDTPYRPFSYAIQKKPSEFWVSFWSGGRNVRIFNVDLCKFTAELEQRFENYKTWKQSQNAQGHDGVNLDQIAARRQARRAKSGRA